MDKEMEAGVASVLMLLFSCLGSGGRVCKSCGSKHLGLASKTTYALTNVPVTHKRHGPNPP